jgi:RNase adaptor protein for sRNA GlmZ degradation
MAEALPIDESIVIVGVCGSGKSTLARGLRALGYPARVCVQEHSYVPFLWMRHGRPRVLVHLQASLVTVCRRREVAWSEEVLALQRERLAVARAHSDLDIDTDPLTADQVRERVVQYLRERHLFVATGT